AIVYRTYLDQATADKLDAKPVEPLLDAVKKAKTRDDLAKLMGRSNGTFGAGFVGAAVIPDLKHPDVYALYLGQSGLGLPDRDFYLRDALKPQKERYQKYVADVLRLIGWDE